MNTDEINAAVQTYGEQQLVAAHARINALAFRQQEPEAVAREMAGVDARLAAYRYSLGQPDDQPDEPQADETPAPAVVVLPGMKG